LSDPQPATLPRTLSRLALALALGIAGGLLFTVLDLPLPWMLGSMLACVLAALTNLPVAVPRQMRPPMTVIIGVMLGSSYTAEMLSSIPGWIVPLIGLMVFMLLSAIISISYLRVVGRFDPITAYFAGMPGGLMEMVILGEEYRADSRQVALVHAARILIVVFTVPFLVQWLSGVEIGSGSTTARTLADTPPETYLWMAGVGVVGVFIGKALRLPAYLLIGPMVLSLIVHVAGITDFRPPVEVIGAAQVVLGASIGCRFVGLGAKRLIAVIGLTFGSTSIMLVLAIVIAYIVAQISGHSITELLLAYSPGGLPEMGLVALALNIEIAMVTVHHVVRVFLVGMGAALFARRYLPAQPETP
jgi:membrane AbrB-like protein